MLIINIFSCYKSFAIILIMHCKYTKEPPHCTKRGYKTFSYLQYSPDDQHFNMNTPTCVSYICLIMNVP